MTEKPATKRIRIKLGDVFALPFEDGSFPACSAMCRPTGTPRALPCTASGGLPTTSGKRASSDASVTCWSWMPWTAGRLIIGVIAERFGIQGWEEIVDRVRDW